MQGVLDYISVIGTAPSRFQGMKKYVSIELRILLLSEQGVIIDKVRHWTQLIADNRKRPELFDEVIKSKYHDDFTDEMEVAA